MKKGMKTFYRLVISDPIDQPVRNLPITLQKKFRSFNSVRKSAQIHHKKKCSVVIIEFNEEGMLNAWEINGRCVFPHTFVYLNEGKQYTKA